MKYNLYTLLLSLPESQGLYLASMHLKGNTSNTLAVKKELTNEIM